MTETSLQIVVIFLLILANGAFALSEIAVVSARKPRLRHQAEAGKRPAKLALSLAEHPNDFLSTVQVGITLIGTLAGAVGGATLGEKLGLYLNAVSYIAPHGEAAGILLVVISITYVSLILGELVPKRIALSNPERFAMAVAGPMRLLSRISTPAVRILSGSTNLVLRLMPMRKGAEPTITEAEIRAMIEEGTKIGAFDETEQEMIEGVFRLGDRKVVELMQPRVNIEWLDLRQHPEENLATISGSQYSRFPVGDGNLDLIAGYVHVGDLLHRHIAGQPLDIGAALRPLPAVPDSMRALKLLETFQQHGTHIALVVDEHGGTEGIITMHDILEAVVGSLPAPGEKPDSGVTRREDGSWLVDGMLPIFEFKEIIALGNLPGERDAAFTTVAGFVLAQLGRIPAVGDHFNAGDHRYEIVDLDGKRIDKVLVTELPRRE